jgi:hypothetical protein
VPQCRIEEVLSPADRISEQKAGLETEVINNSPASWDEV